MWHAEHNLYLYPTNPERMTDSIKLMEILKSIDFGKEQPGKQLSGNNRLATGEKFLSYLCFMGCSPFIELEPQPDSPYCYIECENKNEAVFVHGVNTRKFRCTNCGVTISEVGKQLKRKSGEKDKGSQIVCAHCGQNSQLDQQNWRKSAFFARCWIRIGNIYEAEAVPDNTLLQQLQESSNCTWKYAYIRRPVIF